MEFQTFNVGCSRDKTVPISDNWRVLEIGGGANPCPRSNVITNYNHAENQRDAPIKVVPGAKMLECDVQNMSIFKDKEFDYSLCIQVLEHVECPEDACSEIIRVSKAGYIETPAILCEQLLGWPFHKWFVKFDELDKDKIVFIRKKEIDYKHFDNFFHNLFYKKNQYREKFKDIYFKYSDLFLVCLYWQDSFSYEVYR